MKKRYLALLSVIAVLAFTSIAWASDTNEIHLTKPQVEHSWIKRPHSERVVKSFTPPSSPSSSYVTNVIIPYEARRYGGGPLYDRIGCESGYQYNATNGTYNGLIQTSPAFFGPAWSDVIQDKDLGVKLKSKKNVTRGVYKVRLWSTGKKTYNRIAVQHIPRIVIKKGQLPKNASEWHAWAAVRVGQRAISGHGPTTYWACTHNGSHY